ncbi:MAG: aldehyde dehydrogenase family protein [Candidatus Aminicenantaceae bacterium]
MPTQTKTPIEDAERAASQVDLGFKTWSHLSLKTRIESIRRLRKVISKNARRIAEAISKENNRPIIESLSQEVLPVLEMAKHCEMQFPKWLARRRLPYRRPGFWQKKNTLFYEPIGPVAIFSPQNFPFSLGMMTLIYSILPGNTVLLKTSDKSRLVSPLIEEILIETGLIASKAAAVLPGDAKTGQWLIQNPSIKKIFFFGKRKSGEEVADLCQKSSKPFVLEMGGGSTAFVCADANIELAATGLAWSSFYTHGLSCVSTEKIFVDERIADKFISAFKLKVTNFQRDMAASWKEGVCNSPDVSRLNGLIANAKALGAEVFQAEMPFFEEKSGFFRFTVIYSATNSMRVFNEDIFGPVVAVQAVLDLEKAISESNNDFQPMGVSIWSRNHKKAHELAKKAQTGKVWINDSSFGLPNLPWGGWGNTGRGNLFSEFAIQEVTQLKWVSKHSGRFSRSRFWWNPYSSWKEKLMMKIAQNFF